MNKEQQKILIEGILSYAQWNKKESEFAGEEKNCHNCKKYHVCFLMKTDIEKLMFISFPYLGYILGSFCKEYLVMEDSSN